MRPLGRRIYYLIGVSAVVMLIAGAMLVGPALADAGQASGSSPSPSGQPSKHIAGVKYEDFISKLAANLGISDTSKVDSAVKSTLSQMVDERQQSGKLTQAQADKPKQWINTGEFPGGILDGPHGHGMLGKRFNMDQLATFFGESTADLKTELQQGNSLAAIAQKHGKSRDDLKKFLTDQFTAHESKMASNAESKFQNNLDQLIDRTWPAKGANPNASPATSPSASPSAAT